MHMSETMKRRGRPVGTDLKLDKIALEQVADAMIANPALKPMTAMKAIFDTGAFTGPGYRQRLTTVTRWQAKWKTVGEQTLAEARWRAERKSSRPVASANFEGLVAFGSGYRPPEGLLRAIERGAKALARYEKDFGPAIEMHRKATEAVKHLAPLPDQARLQAMFDSMPRQLAMPSARELEMIKQAFDSPAVKAMQALFTKKD
jgi:hypothetical protein